MIAFITSFGFLGVFFWVWQPTDFLRRGLLSPSVVLCVTVVFIGCGSVNYPAGHIFAVAAGVTTSSSSPGVLVPPEGYRLFEGDILIRDERVREQKFSPQLFQQQILWPNRGQNIGFDLSQGGFSESFQEMIRSAFQYISEETCVTFVEVDPQNLTSYLQIVQTQPGCFAFLGYDPTGPTVVNLQEDGCNVFQKVVHELCHGLGLLHTQSRADRDQFVFVDFSAVDPLEAHNFEMDAMSGMTIVDVYDYFSIMHYPKDAYALDPNTDTIFAPEPIGIAHVLSNSDAVELAFAYGSCTEEKVICTDLVPPDATVAVGSVFPIVFALSTDGDDDVRVVYDIPLPPYIVASRPSHSMVSNFGTVIFNLTATPDLLFQRVNVTVDFYVWNASIPGARCSASVMVVPYPTPLNCFGRLATDPGVCNGHGQCVLQDTCKCNSTYNGLECQNVADWSLFKSVGEGYVKVFSGLPDTAVASDAIPYLPTLNHSENYTLDLALANVRTFELSRIDLPIAAEVDTTVQILVEDSTGRPVARAQMSLLGGNPTWIIDGYQYVEAVVPLRGRIHVIANSSAYWLSGTVPVIDDLPGSANSSFATPRRYLNLYGLVRCKDGYYGSKCQYACPGRNGSQPAASQCHWHGVCRDGPTGDGRCTCFGAELSQDCHHVPSVCADLPSTNCPDGFISWPHHPPCPNNSCTVAYCCQPGTPTFSVTPTATISATRSLSGTYTQCLTISLTSSASIARLTGSPSSTSSLTSLPSATSTAAATSTVLQSLSPSLSRTAFHTFSVSRTHTGSPKVSLITTFTRSATTSPFRSQTPTPTISYLKLLSTSHAAFRTTPSVDSVRATATETLTMTETSAQSSTHSLTPTLTGTMAWTSSCQPTLTSTITPTISLTKTGSNIQTFTPHFTKTPTPTASVTTTATTWTTTTATDSAIATSTETSLATQTSALTPTRTSAPTPTYTATPSTTQVASISETPSPSVESVSASQTPTTAFYPTSITPTTTISASQTETITSTSDSTSTATTQATASSSGTHTPSATASFSATSPTTPTRSSTKTAITRTEFPTISSEPTQTLSSSSTGSSLVVHTETMSSTTVETQTATLTSTETRAINQFFCDRCLLMIGNDGSSDILNCWWISSNASDTIKPSILTNPVGLLTEISSTFEPQSTWHFVLQAAATVGFDVITGFVSVVTEESVASDPVRIAITDTPRCNTTFINGSYCGYSSICGPSHYYDAATGLCLCLDSAGVCNINNGLCTTQISGDACNLAGPIALSSSVDMTCPSASVSLSNATMAYLDLSIGTNLSLTAGSGLHSELRTLVITGNTIASTFITIATDLANEVLVVSNVQSVSLGDVMISGTTFVVSGNATMMFESSTLVDVTINAAISVFENAVFSGVLNISGSDVLLNSVVLNGSAYVAVNGENIIVNGNCQGGGALIISGLVTSYNPDGQARNLSLLGSEPTTLSRFSNRRHAFLPQQAVESHSVFAICGVGPTEVVIGRGDRLLLRLNCSEGGGPMSITSTPSSSLILLPGATLVVTDLPISAEAQTVPSASVCEWNTFSLVLGSNVTQNVDLQILSCGRMNEAGVLPNKLDGCSQGCTCTPRFSGNTFIVSVVCVTEPLSSSLTNQPSKSPDKALIIGLAVGLPVVSIICLVLLAFVISKRRRHVENELVKLPSPRDAFEPPTTNDPSLAPLPDPVLATPWTPHYLSHPPSLEIIVDDDVGAASAPTPAFPVPSFPPQSRSLPQTPPVCHPVDDQRLQTTLHSTPQGSFRFAGGFHNPPSPASLGNSSETVAGPSHSFGLPSPFVSSGLSDVDTFCVQPGNPNTHCFHTVVVTDGVCESPQAPTPTPLHSPDYWASSSSLPK